MGLDDENCGETNGRAIVMSNELRSIFPTQANGHGLLIRDNIRDFTKLQEGPYALSRFP